MILHEQIQKDAEDALRSGEKVRLSVLRDIKTVATNTLVAARRQPDEKLSDEEILGVIGRLAKQRKESIEQFEAGGRRELAEKEKEELSILQEYLPEQLSQEEIERLVLAKKEELGIENMSGMGRLIGAVMEEVGARVNGKVVADIVKKILS